MRRLLALPALLFIASIAQAFGGTWLGTRADRLGHDLACWASAMS